MVFALVRTLVCKQKKFSTNQWENKFSALIPRSGWNWLQAQFGSKYSHRVTRVLSSFSPVLNYSLCWLLRWVLSTWFLNDPWQLEVIILAILKGKKYSLFQQPWKSPQIALVLFTYWQRLLNCLSIYPFFHFPLRNRALSLLLTHCYSECHHISHLPMKLDIVTWLSSDHWNVSRSIVRNFQEEYVNGAFLK